MSPLGAVHTVFAFLAIFTGAVVCLLPKGTRWHRTWGHLYGTTLLGVVVTALLIYRLTGSFGPFHLAALLGGGTLAAGMAAVLLRRPRKGWMEAHATWMSWSYVGLLAAFAAETLTRFILPRIRPFLQANQLQGAFWTVVGFASFVVAGIGWWAIDRYLPGALQRTPRAIREGPGRRLG